MSLSSFLAEKSVNAKETWHTNNVYILAFEHISRKENFCPEVLRHDTKNSVRQSYFTIVAVAANVGNVLETVWAWISSACCLQWQLTEYSYLFQLLFELLCHHKLYTSVYNLQKGEREEQFHLLTN